MTETTAQKQKKEDRFGELLKQHVAALPKEGDLVSGTVISSDHGAVRVDIGGMTTGIVRGEELFADSREYADLHVGDNVSAIVLEQENEQGEMELSFRVAGQQLVWDRMRQWMAEAITIPVKILSANKGGLLARLDGMNGFLPVSQLDPDHYPRVPGGDKNKILEHLRTYVGHEFQVKLLDINEQEDKLILSQKAVWEDAQKAVLDSYKVGDTITGEVSAITSFGAFVKFGQGLEGLVHISEIVWQRIDHPKDILHIGDSVTAQIIDLNKSKIYLSMKRLIEDPWKTVKDRYEIGQIVKGEVHKVEPFGLMVKLDDHIHGLAHISELSNTPLTEETMREKFVTGAFCDFEVVNIEPSEHRLGLRLSGVKPAPQAETKEKENSEKAEDTE